MQRRSETSSYVGANKIMFVNWKLDQVNLKIVYYGPPSSGKTANLQWIRAHGKAGQCSELMSRKTHEKQTLFFDFMQIALDPIRNLKPKLNLYTVVGKVHHRASHKLLLQGADGVVFVADSQDDRACDNVESMNSLREILCEMGHCPDTFPLVIQYNKRDLPHALPVSALASQLAHDGIPQFESVANQGVGVLETLQAVIDLVVQRAQD